MRKQYHFRQVGDDTYIWDVHRLVGLSQDLPIHDVLLSDTLYTTNFTEPLSYQDSAFLKLPKFP